VAEHPPRLPIHQEFRAPDTMLCLSSSVLVEPEMISLLGWSPVYEDHILWPRFPMLHIIGLLLQLHVAAPMPKRDVHIFAPVVSLSCSPLYWHHTLDRCPRHWPSPLPKIPDTLVFDWSEQLNPRGMFAGQVMRVLEYRFPAQLRYITCLQLNPLLGGYAGTLALRSAFLVALNMLALPCHSVHQHHRLAMLPPSQTQW